MAKLAKAHSEDSDWRIASMQGAVSYKLENESDMGHRLESKQDKTCRYSGRWESRFDLLDR